MKLKTAFILIGGSICLAGTAIVVCNYKKIKNSISNTFSKKDDVASTPTEENNFSMQNDQKNNEMDQRSQIVQKSTTKNAATNTTAKNAQNIAGKNNIHTPKVTANSGAPNTAVKNAQNIAGKNNIHTPKVTANNAATNKVAKNAQNIPGQNNIHTPTVTANNAATNKVAKNTQNSAGQNNIHTPTVTANSEAPNTAVKNAQNIAGQNYTVKQTATINNPAKNTATAKGISDDTKSANPMIFIATNNNKKNEAKHVTKSNECEQKDASTQGKTTDFAQFKAKVLSAANDEQIKEIAGKANKEQLSELINSLKFKEQDYMQRFGDKFKTLLNMLLKMRIDINYGENYDLKRLNDRYKYVWLFKTSGYVTVAHTNLQDPKKTAFNALKYYENHNRLTFTDNDIATAILVLFRQSENNKTDLTQQESLLEALKRLITDYKKNYKIKVKQDNDLATSETFFKTFLTPVWTQHPKIPWESLKTAFLQNFNNSLLINSADLDLFFDDLKELNLPVKKLYIHIFNLAVNTMAKLHLECFLLLCKKCEIVEDNDDTKNDDFYKLNNEDKRFWWCLLMDRQKGFATIKHADFDLNLCLGLNLCKIKLRETKK